MHPSLLEVHTNFIGLAIRTEFFKAELTIQLRSDEEFDSHASSLVKRHIILIFNHPNIVLCVKNLVIYIHNHIKLNGSMVHSGYPHFSF